MDFRVDEKGKYFTQQVNKRSIPVVARVDDSIIHGIVYLTLHNRLKDELNTGEEFIAVTDAKVWAARDDRLLYETPVLIVNKRQIAWIFPREAESKDNS